MGRMRSLLVCRALQYLGEHGMMAMLPHTLQVLSDCGG